MAVNWGLAPQPFDALSALREYGAAQAQQLKVRQLQRQQQQEDNILRARQEAAAQLGAQDYTGAGAAALAAGDFDLYKHIGGLQADQRKALVARNELLGRAAFSLRKVPQEQRAAALQAMAPQLMQQGGFTQQELAQTDLSDAGLDGYYGLSMEVKDRLAGDLAQARIADVATDNARADTAQTHTFANQDAHLALSRNADRRGAAADARAAQARAEGRVRFNERALDRQAVASSGGGVRTDLSDLDY